MSPLPTDIPVSDFLGLPQAQIYTQSYVVSDFLGLLMPGRVCFSPRRFGLNPRSIPNPPWERKKPKKKPATAVLGNLIFVPGSLRLSQIVSQSWLNCLIVME